MEYVGQEKAKSEIKQILDMGLAFPDRKSLAPNQENLFESLATTRQAQMNFNSKLSPSSAQLSFVKLSPY